MAIEAPKLYNVATQRAEIRNSITQRKYRNLITRHFYEKRDGQWLSHVKEEAATHPEWAENPAYYQLLGLGGITAAQFGFPQIEGQLSRYFVHQWSHHPSSSPRHQLAVATYTAGHNLETFKIKEDIIEELDNPQLAPGVWGLFFYPREGNYEHPTHVEDKRTAAQERLSHKMPICLPDRELNRRLATIRFTGDDADRMPQVEFERDIYPEVQAVTQDLGLLDPVTIFVHQ